MVRTAETEREGGRPAFDGKRLAKSTVCMCGSGGVGCV